MQNCFRKSVGLLKCDELNYKYVLDSYGLSLEDLIKIADNRSISGKKLFEDISTEAYQSIINDITFKGFEASKILQDIQLKSSDCTEKKYNGIQTIDFNCYNKDCTLINFWLGEIRLKVVQGGATSIKITYNGATQELYNSTIANNSVISIDISEYIAYKFTISVDMTNITVCGGEFDSDCAPCGVFYTKSKTDSLGLEIDMRVQCDKSVWVCKHKDILALSYIYKILGLYWHRSYMSNRTKETDTAFELSMMNYYDNSYNALIAKDGKPSGPGVYQIQLEKAASQIQPPKCRCCIECDTIVQSKIAIR